MKTGKNMTNLQIAKLLRSVAAGIGLSDDGLNTSFRIAAYEKAADAIEHASSEAKDLWDDGKLSDLAGVGESIAGYLDELFRTGKVKHFQSILKKFPDSVWELMEVPGIGPKNALKLSKALGISKAHTAIAKLTKAAKAGHIAKLEGFGADSQAKILQGIQEFSGRTSRLLLPTAMGVSDSIIDWMKKIPQVKHIDVLGSLRRFVATVGDIDLSVASDEPKEVMDHFTKFPKKTRVLEAGEHSASLILPNEYQVDLMVQPVAAYGSLLQHFTGSKHHNIKLREYALKKGYSLSEYGIKKLKNKNSKIKTFATEVDLYNFLGLEWIPPELREGGEEIEAAKTSKLPDLITIQDIKGDLQIHSDFDIETNHDVGASSLRELAGEAQRLGYEYIGITDHNPSFSQHTSRQIVDLIKRRSEHVYKFNSSENRVHIFNGLEIDIRPNGMRALPDVALDLLDYACVSIHSSFSGMRDKMTERVLAAMDHPKVLFWAHPTGRILQQREGVEVDWDKIFDYCTTHHKWLEIDGWPNRLDLPDSVARDAVRHGVKLVVDTDSHAADQMDYMRFGVAVARRAWATKEDVINTQPLAKIRQLMQ